MPATHLPNDPNLSWLPDAPPPADEPPSDRFLRLACLTYSDDETADRTSAARLIAQHPELPAISLPVAAACADVAQVNTDAFEDAGARWLICGCLARAGGQGVELGGDGVAAEPFDLLVEVPGFG